MVANQLASGWDEVFVVANVLLAGCAFGFNLAAAFGAGRTLFARTVHSAISALALAYVVGYLVLLATDVSVVRWSSVMHGVSMAAWLIAWIGPTLIHVRCPEEQVVLEFERRMAQRGADAS